MSPRGGKGAEEEETAGTGPLCIRELYAKGGGLSQSCRKERIKGERGQQ